MINIINIEDSTLDDYAIGPVTEFFKENNLTNNVDYSYELLNPNSIEIYNNILNRIRNNNVDLCILDLHLTLPSNIANIDLGRPSGLVDFEDILKIKPEIPVIFLTASYYNEISRHIVKYTDDGIQINYFHKYDFGYKTKLKTFFKSKLS